MTHIVFEEMHDINALSTAARADHERTLWAVSRCHADKCLSRLSSPLPCQSPHEAAKECEMNDENLSINHLFFESSVKHSNSDEKKEANFITPRGHNSNFLSPDGHAFLMCSHERYRRYADRAPPGTWCKRQRSTELAEHAAVRLGERLDPAVRPHRRCCFFGASSMATETMRGGWTLSLTFWDRELANMFQCDRKVVSRASYGFSILFAYSFGC